MIINDEYESAFPVEQEYQLWINGIERDYVEEAQYRAKLVITDQTQVHVTERNYYIGLDW